MTDPFADAKKRYQEETAPAQAAAEKERFNAREQLNKDLDWFLDDERRRFLLEEVLAMTKRVSAECQHCHRMTKVEIPDAKAVIPMLGELMTQAKGRPGTALEADTGPRIVFERTVVYRSRDDEETPEVEPQA